MIKAALTLLLIASLFLATLGYVFSRLADGEFLIAQAREANAYSRIIGQAPNFLPDEAFIPFVLTDNEKRQIIEAGLDGQTFYSLAEAYLDFQLDWLRGREHRYYFRYDLTVVNERAKIKAQELILARYAALPACQQNQLRAWRADAGLPICRLPANTGFEQDEINNLLKQQIEQLFANERLIPQELVLTQPSQQQLELRTAVQLADRIIHGIWLITGLLLALYLLLYRRRALLPLGVVFIVGGLLQLGFGQIGWDWLGRLVVEYIGDGGENVVVAVITDVSVLSLTILQTTLGTLTIAFFGIGIGLIAVWLISLFRRPKPSLL